MYSVSQRQARLALLKAGLLAQAEAVIQQDPEATIWWEYASQIDSDNPLLLQVAQVLNLDPDQVESMFRFAANL